MSALGRKQTFSQATLWMAVLADIGTTLIVTLNGKRLWRS